MSGQDYLSLYKAAEKARVNAHAPYSGFKVGAALLTGDGRVFTGVNVENSSFGATICAERTAFVKAISEGVRDFEAIAVSAGDEPAVPCGICRQFMSDFAPDLKVVTGPSDEDGNGLKVIGLRELFPEAFVLDRQDRQ